MSVIEMPFEIGQKLWAPATSPRQVTVPCPVCAGARAVTVILGSGERVGVACDACGLGFDGARGVIKEWEYDPHTEPFEIAAVRSMRDGRWTLVSTTGTERQFDELCATEADALAVSTLKCAEIYERNMQTRQHKRAGVQRHTWSIQYHRKQIKDLERQIAWHTGKITAR